MSCLDCHDFMDGYNRGKREGTIEELEKIKQEINNGYPTSVEDILWIIDNEISELKGETE